MNLIVPEEMLNFEQKGMEKAEMVLGVIPIEERILTVRGKQVILDRDLAELYNVETKRLNEQVKRNIDRFPENFMFRLSRDEVDRLVAICDRFDKLKHSSSMPYAFTEQGVAMLSAVLHSKVAVNVSINIMNAFVTMRRFHGLRTYAVDRLAAIERRQMIMEDDIEKIFCMLDNTARPTEGIFYDGQIFDAYVFVADLVKSAKCRIVLIDNYVDESTLLILSKRSAGVSAEIRTGRMTKDLQLDVQKHNSQYAPVNVLSVKNIHDRFLIVDDTVYHIGASLKDLGKKLFAFSRMTIPPKMVL